MIRFKKSKTDLISHHVCISICDDESKDEHAEHNKEITSALECLLRIVLHYDDAQNICEIPEKEPVMKNMSESEATDPKKLISDLKSCISNRLCNNYDDRTDFGDIINDANKNDIKKSNH